MGAARIGFLVFVVLAALASCAHSTPWPDGVCTTDTSCADMEAKYLEYDGNVEFIEHRRGWRMAAPDGYEIWADEDYGTPESRTLEGRLEELFGH